MLVRSRSGWYGIYSAGTESVWLVRTFISVGTLSVWLYGSYSVVTQSVWLARKLLCWYAVGLAGTEVVVLVRSQSDWHGSYSVGTQSVWLYGSYSVGT